MNYIDIIVLILTVVGFLLGFKDGLIRKLIGLIGLFAAFYISFFFAENVGKFILPIFNNEQGLANIFAGIILFFLVILLFSILKRIIHPLDKVNKLLNQLLGGIAGTIQILFFISAILLLLNNFNVPDENDKNKSLLYNKVYLIVPSATKIILGNNSSLQDYLQRLIKTNTKTIDN